MKQARLSRRSSLRTAGAVAGSSLLHNVPSIFGQGLSQDTGSAKADLAYDRHYTARSPPTELFR